MTDMLKPLSTSSFFFKQRLDKIEYSDLITEWIYNMDTAAYME